MQAQQNDRHYVLLRLTVSVNLYTVIRTQAGTAEGPRRPVHAVLQNSSSCATARAQASQEQEAACPNSFNTVISAYTEQNAIATNPHHLLYNNACPQPPCTGPKGWSSSQTSFVVVSTYIAGSSFVILVQELEDLDHLLTRQELRPDLCLRRLLRSLQKQEMLHTPAIACLDTVIETVAASAQLHVPKVW